jgi:hypothetical protein
MGDRKKKFFFLELLFLCLDKIVTRNPKAPRANKEFNKVLMGQFAPRNTVTLDVTI